MPQESEKQNLTPNALQAFSKFGKKMTDKSAEITDPQETKLALEKMEKEWEETNLSERTFDRFDEYIRNLYMLLVRQKSTEGERLCLDAMMSLEDNMKKIFGEGLSKLPTELIHRSEQYELQLREDTTQYVVALMKNMSSDVQKRCTLQDGVSFYESRNSNGEVTRWRIDPHNLHVGMIFCFRSTENDENREGAMAFLPMDDFQKLLTNESAQDMDDILNKSLEQRMKEREGWKKLDAYDLPEGEKIVHIRVSPKIKDPNGVIPGNISTAMMLRFSMENRYPGRMEKRPILFTNNPEEDLYSELIQIQKDLGEEKYCVVIDILSHGSPEHLNNPQ